MTSTFHPKLLEKLTWFHTINKIPNILFYGPNGSGKQSLVISFINAIYSNNKQMIRDYMLYVNCAHGKGIKFIREEIKFFAKTNIMNFSSSQQQNALFKCIVLVNADKLTTDAQSALRRCIEIYSKNTRFFMITTNLNNIMLPIVSRFYKMHVPLPLINGIAPTHICRHIIDTTIGKSFSPQLQKGTKYQYIHKALKNMDAHDMVAITTLVTKLYNYGCSANDLIDYISTQIIPHKTELEKYRYIMEFNTFKQDVRNESLLILHILVWGWGTLPPVSVTTEAKSVTKERMDC